MFKKLKTLKADGLDPFIEGAKNYHKLDLEIEDLARKRAEVCRSCDERVREPISFLRITDERIPTLHEHMCNGCGCSLPYLLRQSIKICEKWQKNTSTSKRT